MDTNTESKDGATTVVAAGMIRDAVAFKATMNEHIKRICAVRRSWASDEATEFFVTLVDEYIAQLPDGAVPDAGDLKPYFARMVNMNACNNRYADAGLITRTAKGTKKVGTDLL